MLEEQRLAIERHYEEKLEAMRREMEIRNDLEKEKLTNELEKLRISANVEIPSVTLNDQGTSLGSPGAENDPYEVMKSIAFQPINSSRQRTTSIRIKDITGSGNELFEHHSNSPPVSALQFSPSPSPARHTPTPEPPLLSPATGQTNTPTPPFSATMPLSQYAIDPEMRQLLDTYAIIENTDGIEPTHPVDVVDYTQNMTTSSFFSSEHPSTQHVLSASCPNVATSDPTAYQPHDEE